MIIIYHKTPRLSIPPGKKVVAIKFGLVYTLNYWRCGMGKGCGCGDKGGCGK